jgi:hypothetical protein
MKLFKNRAILHYIFPKEVFENGYRGIVKWSVFKMTLSQSKSLLYMSRRKLK